MSGYVSATIAVVGAAMSAYSEFERGKAEQRQAQFKSEMAERNSKIAEQNALMAEEEGREAKRIGSENAQKKRLEAAGIIGAQRAAAGASGAQVDSGAFMDLQLDTAEKGELDALALTEQGQQEDYNKRVEAWNLREQGQGLQLESRMHTSNAKGISPWLSAGGTFLSGVGGVGMNYKKMIG